MKDECYNPNAISDEAVDEWVRCTTAPGGLRAIFEVYRATFENIELVEDWKSEKLDIPVLTVGSKAFIDEEVERQMEKTTDVNRSVIFEECGHSLALEAPERLAGELHEFMN
jgi:pimeloyl-ACP methyl ester carboxylesterase